MNKEAIRLLDRLYKDLYLNESVLHHGSGNKYDKFNNIKSYIDKLEDIHTRVSETGRHVDYLKQLYYDKYVIKKEDIPESYYEHQKEIALERGYGHVEITEGQKSQIQEEVINNQKARLDIWLDYFLSENASVYPFWAKYWAFQGMLKLGTYDKEKGEFHKRTKNTVEPFADLNREALAMSIDVIIKMLNKEEIDDKELEILVKTGSFPRIYSYILTKVLKDNKNITKRNIGKWIKYDRGSDHLPLVESLKGYNTGWCTAGESTAWGQLQAGDFYVYYTLDENDEYKVPRIAIRMEYNKIGEIRGIASGQNIESEMEEVVEEKLKEFPDRDQYYKKVSDMKKLTSIYKKHKNNEEITKEELRFLYEIDEEIIGFGYGKDPRIKEIIEQRLNKREDIANIIGCHSYQVAFNKEQLNNETIYFDGNLDLSLYINAKNINIKIPEFICGNLDLGNLKDAKDLNLPKNIRGNLLLKGLTSAEGLVLPRNVDGDLHLSSLYSAEGLRLPDKIGGSLWLNSLRSAEGLVFPKSIGGSLYLADLMSAEGLMLPTSVGGDLHLSLLSSAEGLVLPKNVGLDLHLNYLNSAKGVVFPDRVGGTLWLNRLRNAEGLVLPKSIGSCLYLASLNSAEGLVLPTSVDDDLYLSGLYSAEGLILPDRVGGTLWLGQLMKVKDLVLPKCIGGSLYLTNLNSVEGLIIPEPLTYKIHMCGFDITPENVDQYRNNKTK